MHLTAGACSAALGELSKDWYLTFMAEDHDLLASCSIE
jgi:hypothetical protein